jgi:hypothetical protein
MKLATLLMISPLLALCACTDGQAPAPSATPPARSSEPAAVSKTCIDALVDARQFAEISKRIALASEEPVELQAAALAQTLDATLGRATTLQLLRSGLLTDWLAAATRSEPVPAPSTLCKPLSGEEV